MPKDTPKFDVMEWIRANEDILSIYRIEKLLEIPEGILVKAIKGYRNLPKKWETPLTNFIQSRLP
jgi:hypothetical protein